MKSSKFNVENRLLEIQDKIALLDVEEDFKHVIGKDVILAIEFFKEKNILGVINCLAVLVDKLQTYVIFSDPVSAIKKLLIRIHRLQQMLIKLPICLNGPSKMPEPIKSPVPIHISDSPEPVTPAEIAGSVKTYGVTVTTRSIPVSHYPIPQEATRKPFFRDISTHVVIYRNPRRKKK